MRRSVPKIAALLATGVTLASASFAALPASDSAAVPGPPDASAMPSPTRWLDKVICLPGMPLEQAGLCGTETTTEIA